MNAQSIEIARRVALEQEIGRKSDENDRRAKEHAESLIQTELYKRKTQVRALETLSYTTDKVSDVTDWLKVRVGRDSDGKGWAKEGIGRDILNWLETFRTDAEQIVRELEQDELLQEKDPDLVRQVHLRLIREYLKHLAAHFEYKQAEKKK